MKSSNTAPSRPRRGRFASALLILVAGPALTGCVSEVQMRLAIEDRDRQIAMLRTDKVELQERLDLLSYEKEDLRAQLDAAPTNQTVPAAFSGTETATDFVAFPELEAIGITTGQRAGETVISVPAEVSFGSGKATLSTQGQGALQKVAARLKSDFGETAKFHIEGHTDSDPIRKSKFSSNRELSIARAMAVLQYLVSEGRVADRRFVVAGHGEYEPVASNSGADKAKNRRVEIVVKTQ